MAPQSVFRVVRRPGTVDDAARIRARKMARDLGTGHCRLARHFSGLRSAGRLGLYAYENPENTFPEVTAEGPCFDAEQVGHPLLPDERCIRNDVRLGDDLRLLVVSGSNMSGKSTLLRTV